MTRKQLDAAGFWMVGQDVKIDPGATFINPGMITIGDRCRIDAQCILSAGSDGIILGRGVHLAVGCLLFGGGGRITFEDYSGCSPRCILYTESDVFPAGRPLGPTHDAETRATKRGQITLKRQAGLGSGVVVLPGVTVGKYAAVACYCILRHNVREGQIVVSEPRQIVMGQRDTAEMRRIDAELEARDNG